MSDIDLGLVVGCVVGIIIGYAVAILSDTEDWFFK